MKWPALLLVAACHHAPPTPAPSAPVVNRVEPDAGVVAETTCISDERQWGTTCCEIHHVPPGEHDRDTGSCRGPNLGKPCHAKGDCDMNCQCDPKYIHKDGMTGVSGRCVGLQPAGEWLCNLDEKGRVTSLIID